jgi:hypothetical protein
VHANRIALAFVLAGLAAPALAEKCSVCDFSDEPIVVKPRQSSDTPSVQLQDHVSSRPRNWGWKDQQASGGAPSVGELVVTKLSDSTNPSFDRDRPLVRGSIPNAGPVATYNIVNAWPSKGGSERPLAGQQVAPSVQGTGTYSKTLTFTLSTTTPLAPGARLAAPNGSPPTPATQASFAGGVLTPPTAAPAGPGFRR